MYSFCLLEIFSEDSALICAFGHILTLSNTRGGGGGVLCIFVYGSVRMEGKIQT